MRPSSEIVVVETPRSRRSRWHRRNTDFLAARAVCAKTYVSAAEMRPRKDAGEGHIFQCVDSLRSSFGAWRPELFQQRLRQLWIDPSYRRQTLFEMRLAFAVPTSALQRRQTRVGESERDGACDVGTGAAYAAEEIAQRIGATDRTSFPGDDLQQPIDFD